jgi:DNA-binding NarL/FixJ family response regulator
VPVRNAACPSVVLAEDQPLLRDAIASLLEAAGVVVLARCATGEELVRHVDLHRPDVAIVDIRMPPTFTDEGLRAASEIRSSFPQTGVLLLSQHVEPEYAARFAGDDPSGVGYLLKERVRDGDDFVDAIYRVADGGTALDPEVVSAVIHGKRRSTLAGLSEREVETLSLMAEGRSNEAIAEHLHLSTRAVEREISSVFAKLDLRPSDAHNRRVLAVLAYLGITTSA